MLVCRYEERVIIENLEIDIRRQSADHMFLLTVNYLFYRLIGRLGIP